MKKLLLFLSLCVTNIVYGDVIDSILERIDNGIGTPDYLANEIMGEGVKIACIAIKNKTLIPDVSISIANIVEKIIIAIKEKGEDFAQKCKVVFDVLDPLQSKNNFDGILNNSKFIGSDEERDNAKKILRAFYASLNINYNFFCSKPAKTIEKHCQENMERIEVIYGEGLDYLGYNCINTSFIDIFNKLYLSLGTLDVRKQATQDCARLKEEFFVPLFDKVRDPDNAPRKDKEGETQKGKSSFLENLSSKKIAAIGGGSAVVLAIALCAGTEKGRKKSSETFELAKEHPKKTVGIIATLLAGGVMAYKLMV